MASKIVWVLPSGRIHTAKKTPEMEEKAQEYASLLQRVIYFFV